MPLKALLLDADGVMLEASQPFSLHYAEKHGFDPTELSQFFTTDFIQATLGQQTVAEAIKNHAAAWHLVGDPETIIQEWLAYGGQPNQPLVDYLQTLRAHGIQCFLATNQEQRRTDHLRNIIFPKLLDGIFSSAELGFRKPDPEFYQEILTHLSAHSIQPEEVIYFDDKQENLDSASKFGIHSFPYTGLETFKQQIMSL